MTEEDYIEQRLNNQINWYSKKSSTNQKKHKYWQVIKIISALLITTLSLWATKALPVDNSEGIPFAFNIVHVIGILGAFIVFIESFVKIFNYEKLWLQYRMTSERLKREKLLFQTKSIPYNNEDAFALLVQQCEVLMQNEVQGWTELFDKAKYDPKLQ